MMHAHVDGASTHAPSDAIIVPDAQLLFGGDFKRSGVDLVLSNDHQELVLHDYFKGEKRVALASPDGAHLTGDLVNALAGHVEYAQADGGAAAAAVVVGHVTKLTGTATAIRNGVSIILNQGDNIDKGDVLQSGADSTLGVTFIDGTVFGLSSNARMVVNEMVYDPNGSNNSSLLSLVAGTISFVAGETAKHGDMKVDTPVATMGIRGTAVLVEIDFDVPGQNGAPSADFQVLVEPDGTTGSYILFDKNTLAPLATVNTAGTLTKISEGVVTFQTGTPLSPDQQKLIQDLFTTKFGDANTKLFQHFTDAVIPQSLAPIYLPGNVIATPIVLLATPSVTAAASATGGPLSGPQHISGAPLIATFSQGFGETPGVTGSHTPDTVSSIINFIDPNSGDRPTVTVQFSSFTYQDAHGNNITTLTAQEQAAIAAVEGISVQQNAGNTNYGSATWTYSFPDSAFDFLGAGETLTLTYTALVNENYAPSPETGTKQFTITITGTNDVPVITSSIPQTIAFVGGTSVPGGELTAHVPTSGTISFDDPDLTDTHTVSVQLALNGLNLPPGPLAILEKALTVSIANDSTGSGFGTINWKLADLPVYLADFIPKGQTITLDYEVTVTDSQGATATQDITVTITGTDTPAVVWIATTTTGEPSGGLWSDGANWETGNVPTANDDAIIITDQLIGLTPSYPVTIDAKTVAAANSVTMNDYGTSPPELDNLGTLTVGGAFDMSADSILHNSGTISVGGLMEVLDESVLLNSGTLNLEDGGDFSGQSTITNTDTGLIEISGGTLNVQVDIANDGTIKIDQDATLALGLATVAGGIVTNNGTLTLDGEQSSTGIESSAAVTTGGNAVLKDGTLNNNGVLDAETGAVLQHETVVNTGTIEVLALGSLTLDQLTTVDNSTGVIAIDGTGTLTLDDATINGGTVNDFSADASGSIIAGDIDVTGSSTVSNAQLNNGNVTIESDVVLTLDGTTATGTYFTDTADGATIQIDGDTTLTLSGVTINGGIINDYSPPSSPSGGIIAGDIDVTGSSTISNANLNNGNVTIESGVVLTLDGDTVTGTSFIDSAGGAAILIDGSATLDEVTITGGIITNSGATLTIDAHETLTLQGGASLVGGTLSNSGTLDIESSSGATLDGVTVTGSGSIRVDVPVPSATPTLVLDDGTSITSGALTVGPFGTLAIETAGGATLHGVNVTNENSIEVFAGSVLILDQLTTVDNSTGVIAIDGTGTLTLDDATINGGTVNDFSADASGSIIAGDIDVTGSSTVGNAQLNNGNVTIESDVVLTLDGTTATGTYFTDTADGATIQIDGDTTLTLSGVTINGGIINDFSPPSSPSGSIIAGDIDVTGSSTISNAHLNNGQVTIESDVVLTLDNDTVTGTSFADAADGATIQIDGATTLTLSGVTINGGTINDFSPPSSPSGSIIPGDIDVTGSSTISNAFLNNGNVTIESGQTLTLDGTTATGTNFTDTADGATIQVDGGTTLKLDGATIDGGTINDFSPPSSPSGSIIAGDIDVTGSSTISNANLNNGNVTIESGVVLTLDGDTVTGTSFIDSAGGAGILIDGSATLDEVTITGGTITNSGAILTIDAGETLTLQGGASLVGGTLSNSGTLDIESSSGATLDGVTVTGSGSIQVDVPVPSATPTLVLDDGTSITSGTLTVGPFGTLAIETAGGATLHGVNVTNENSIEVFAGSVLILDQLTTVDNSTGVIAIDGTGTLTLDDATINGGTVTNNGALTLGGNAALKSGTLYNYSQINVSSAGNELDSENITNSSAIAILALGVLTLDHLTTIDNTGGLITVYGTGTLALNDATVNGGTINDYSPPSSPSGNIIPGDIDVTGSSTISGAHLNNGQVTIESSVALTLDNDTVSGTLFTDTADGAVIQVDGDTTLKLSDVTINGGIINDFSPPLSPSGSIVAGDIDVTGSSTISGAHLNNGEVTLESGVVLTLDNDTVTGTYFTDAADGATIQVDGGTTLKLDGATIDGGTINDFSPPSSPSGSIVAGDIDVIGSSTISDAGLNHGNVTIESGQKLTLDGDTVNGTAFTNVATDSVIHVDGGDTLALNDATTITGGGVTIDAGALVKTSGDVTLTNTSVTNDGTIEVTAGTKLTITGSGSVADSVANDGGKIQIDAGAVLELNESDTQNVSFDGAGAKLQIDTGSFGGNIVGLAATDQIDLSTIGYGLGTTGTYVSNASHTGGTLTITDGTHSISMALTGDYSNAHFAGSSDGNDGTLITLNANDDAPVFAAADKSESATVMELPNTTGSSALDPSTPASGTLHFTDIDLTDRPTATVTQTVTLTDATTTLTSNEIQALEQAFTLTQPVNTNNGSLGWTYQITDSTLDFLSAGENAIVTSTITLDDHHGGTDTATVTVTIDGANDLPTIVAETDPSVETVILNKSPTVLSAGVTTNSLEMPTETFDNLTAGSASNNGLGHGNFTSTALDATFTASGDAGIVHGSSSVTAAPFMGPLPGQADTTNYLSIGAHSSETIAFASEQNEFGLYWGSADSFNTISFYDGNNLVASYSGTDVAPLLANGNQGSFASNGYVEFSDLAPFNKVVLASGSNAFEVDNISSGFVSDSHIHLADPITGTLTVSDADIGDTLTASVTGNAVAEYNGSTTLPSDINVSALIDSGAITFDTVTTTGGQDVLDWTYNPTNADLDFLESGDKLTLTFNALVSDGHATTETQPLTVTLLGSNASVVNATAQNETFVNVGGGVTIFADSGQDTFVFNKNFGSATISNFNVNTDTIEIDKSLFATVNALLQSAQSANSGHDTIITDAAHDKITLTGVTLAQLQAHPSDFHLI